MCGGLLLVYDLAMRRLKAFNFAVLSGVVIALALLTCTAPAVAANYRPVWLCRPGLANDPCITNLQTGVFSPSGALQSTVTPSIGANPPVDCFYVYPTVSAERSKLSDLKIQTAETDVALYQAAYYQGVCRMYAPMYHQVTLVGAANSAALTASQISEQYESVLNAWNYFLAHYNHDRPFVLIGHSQGAFVLRKLIRRQIDPNPRLRSRMLSAILFGGAVVVKSGSLVGGDFRHIPGCTSTTELGCVVSYSSFPGPPPEGAAFGDVTWSPTDVEEGLRRGQAILCTNPAALGGGSALLDSIFPASFPASAGVVIPAGLGAGHPDAPAWFEYEQSYSAQCVSSHGSDVLEVTPVNGAPPLISTGALAPLWGLHPLDVNLALGDIVNLIGSETRAYLATSTG